MALWPQFIHGRRVMSFTVPAFLLLAAAPKLTLGQRLPLSPAVLASEGALAAAIPELAARVLSEYRDVDRDRDWGQRFPVQMAAGRHRDVIETIGRLTALRLETDPTQLNPTFLPYAIAAGAAIRQAAGRLSFEEAFRAEVQEVFGRLSDKEASRGWYIFRADLPRLDSDLQRAMEAQRGKEGIELADAVDLIGKFEMARSWRAMAPLVDAAAREDDARRYAIDDQVLVATPDGASIAAIVVRPTSTGRLPALLGFTIYADDRQSLAEARRTAAYGYAGVVAYSRGKGRSPGLAMPYEHDGDDASSVIDWISRQPWSDGRVGMYGGSYNGFTQWSAAKRHPAALKAIMPSVTVAPGIDVPMQGNVFFTFVYPWGPYVTNHKGLDEVAYNDRGRWWRMDSTWYMTGRPYRDLDRIDRQPNPVFRRWLEHPSYDEYWQRMIPYREEFAAIDIPVLTTTGYYDGGQVGALYYFTEHHRYNAKAEHYLVIGPYDHPGGQRQSVNVLNGYPIDSAARINFQEQLRYSWFDYVFKGGKKPAVLEDKVNYEVMGANLWKHAPSIEAMAAGSLRLRLSADRAGDRYRLRTDSSPGKSVILHTIDLADRSDLDAYVFTQFVDKRLNHEHGLVFVSDPLERTTEISGLFSGRLDFIANKKDFDVVVQVYQLLPNGEYFSLTASPAYQWRASYARDRGHRQLLVPGKRQTIAFRSERLTSRRMEAGSRIVMLLGVVKGPVQQINYGTDKDVSDQSIADAKAPLAIRWLESSYLDIPISR